MTREEVIALSNTVKSEADSDHLRKFFMAPENISPNRHTIVFSTPSKTGTSAFRLWEPILSIYRFTDEFNLVYTESIEPWHYNLADLLILHRAGDRHDMSHNVINHWPAHKIRPYVLHNVDDNEFQLPKSHPMYDMWISSGRDKQALRSIRESDGVEITTRKLKQVMSNHNRNTWITRNQFNWKLPEWNLPKKRPLTEFIAIENPEKFDFPQEWTDKCVVGWAGLTSHFEDLKKMAVFIQKIHDKYPETVFVIAGMALKDSIFRIETEKDGTKKFIEEEHTDENMKYRNRVTALFSGINPDRLKIYDALPLEQYGWFYSLFDVGISYVEHNTFNSAKSQIKTLEYFAYGTPCVSSNFGGYADLYDEMQKENVVSPEILQKLFCRTEFDIGEWTNNIGYWIENWRSETFNDSAAKLKTFVLREYDIDTQTPQRVGKYKTLIEANIEKEQNRTIQNQFSMNYEFS